VALILPSPLGLDPKNACGADSGVGIKSPGTVVETLDERRPVVVVSPHPFLPAKDREIIFAEFYPQETIGQYLERHNLVRKFGLDGRRPVICTIQGRRVPFEMWPYVRPRVGTLVQFHATVRGGGGDDGDKIGRTIGTLLVAAAAYYTGGLVGVAYGPFAGGLAAGAVAVLGGMAVNAIFPPPKPHIPSNPEESPTYSLAGGSNQLRRFEPMIRVVGTHIVFPDFGAQPYSEFQGEDQFSFYVFDLGYNDLELSDFKLGETPIESFTGVEIQIAQADGKLHLFPGNVDTVEGSALTFAAGWIQRTSSPNATQLAVEISGFLFQITAQGDLANNLATIEINYRRVGTSTWFPIIIEDDTIPGITDINWDAVPEILRVPLRQFVLNQGAASGEIRLANNSRKPLRRTFSWKVPEDQYEVRVRRVTADSVDDKLVSDIVWSQLRTYQPDTTDYTGRKRIALKVKATGQISGSLPAFNCIARARTTVFGGGYAISCDGVDDYVTSAISISPDNGTLELWLKDPAVGAGSYLLRSNANTRTYLNISGANLTLTKGNPAVQIGSAPFVAGAPNQVVITWRLDSGTRKGSFYLNGSAVATDVVFTDATPGTYLTLGAFSDGGTQNAAGIFDGVRYYDDRALTAAEVLEHYKGRYDDETGLKLRWEFDEGQGAAKDSSGNGNDGTLNNGPVYVAGHVDVPRGNVHTSNPAWWYLDCERGRFLGGRRIWGAGLADSRIELEGIKDFAIWCDSQGLTVNLVFEQQLSVFDALQAIALMGRGTPSWGTGKLGVIWDAPSLPVTAVFGMHNIVPGSFEINYSTEDLADVIEGEFTNPDLGWQRDIVRVQVPGTTTQINPHRLQLFGRTDRVLAAQDTNLYAATNAYRNRKYKWTTDWEGMQCARGDVVQLSHDLASLDYSGRFVEGTTATVLKLPKAVPLFVSGAFIVIVKPDGTFATYDVLGGSGTSDTLTPSPALPFDISADASHQPYDYRWLYGPTATPGKKVKIELFRPIDERYVEISAFDELPIFYTAKDNPYTFTPPKPIFGATPVITALTLTPDGVKVGKGYLVRVAIEWKVQGRFSFADVRAAVGDAELTMLVKETKGTVAEIVMTDRQQLSVEVTVYSDLGRIGATAKASLSEFIDFTGSRVPGDVPGFFLSGKVFTWESVEEVDVVGYQLRFHLGTKRTWEDASPLHEGLITEHDWEAASLPLDDVQVTYLIKAVDAAGQYSMNVAAIVRGLGDPAIANVLEVIDHRDLGWPGTITNGSIISGSIEADSSTTFYGPSDADPFYKASDLDVFYDPAVYLEVTYETSVIVPAAPLQGSVVTVQHVLQGNPYYLDWRQDGVGPFYSLNDSDPIYTSDTDPLYDLGDYMPWTGARVIESGDRYQFRLKAAAGAVQGIFSELLVTIDAPDIEEELNNVAISGSGTRLPITKDFTSIKSVQGTLESIGGTAVTFTIEDRDPDLGPLIKARDKDLVAVAGQGDFRVKGW